MSQSLSRQSDQVRRLHELGRAARAAFQEMRSEDAANLYRQALELAQNLGRGQDVVYYRFWYGVALAFTGDNMLALKVLTPTMRNLDGPGRPDDIHNTLTFYISVALEIPLGLKAITEPLDYCYRFLESINRRDWRHQLLLLEAQLAGARGDFELALQKAEQSWAVWKPVYPYFTADAHLEWMIAYALKLDQPQRAAEYLSVWRQDKHDEMPIYRAFGLSYWEAALLRHQGQWERALVAARRCLMHGTRAEKPDEGHMVMARTCMGRGDVVGARAALSHVRLKHIRKHRLLLLDHHLACVRAAAGMPPADDEYGATFPPPSAIADPDATRRAIAQARAIHPLVLAHACRWDAAFECDWRQGRVQERMRRLDAIEAVL